MCAENNPCNKINSGRRAWVTRRKIELWD